MRNEAPPPRLQEVFKLQFQRLVVLDYIIRNTGNVYCYDTVIINPVHTQTKTDISIVDMCWNEHTSQNYIINFGEYSLLLIFIQIVVMITGWSSTSVHQRWQPLLKLVLRTLHVLSFCHYRKWRLVEPKKCMSHFVVLLVSAWSCLKSVSFWNYILCHLFMWTISYYLRLLINLNYCDSWFSL